MIDEREKNLSRVSGRVEVEKKLKNYEKPLLSIYDSLTSITLHGSCLCDVAATDSCPGDDTTCDRGFGGFR